MLLLSQEGTRSDLSTLPVMIVVGTLVTIFGLDSAAVRVRSNIGRN